jgi:hypothetical protein
MEVFDWVLIAIVIVCFGLVLLILWLGLPTRHPELRTVRRVGHPSNE